ncbi:MAG TPA: CHAD domain-containing protein [Planctomycetota bacterium]|nr:CHAD domain-containing protein [Planctomycetota bacterium]
MRDLPSSEAPVTLAQGFARAARQSLDKLREGEAMIRKDGDLEGVHLMRTSLRRLRATVKYLGDHLGRKEQKALQRGLQALMGALGPVRDLDVLRGAIGSVDSLDSAEAEGLGEEIEQRLAAADVAMQETLDGADYRALLHRLELAVRNATSTEPLNLHGPTRILDAIAGVMRRKPADWSEAPEESLHDLRKAVKKLRYALEAFAPAYGRPVSRQIERCRDLQESLGALQDSAVFSSHLKGLRTFVAGQFIATMRTRADGHLKDLPEIWDRTFPPKAMARLGGHLLRRVVKSPKPPKAPAASAPVAASGS